MTERELLPKEEARSTGARVYDAPRAAPGSISDPDKRSMMLIIVMSFLLAVLGFGWIVLMTIM